MMTYRAVARRLYPTGFGSDTKTIFHFNIEFEEVFSDIKNIVDLEIR